MRAALILAAIGVLVSCGGAPASEGARPLADADAAIAELAWLAGTWYRETDGHANEEMWSTPLGDTMMGTNRTISDGRAVYYEFLRIVAADDGVYYEAWPKGQAPARFRMVDSGKRSVTFADGSHDWPQRISYSLRDGELHAEVDGTSDGEHRTERWAWRRVEPAAASM